MHLVQKILRCKSNETFFKSNNFTEVICTLRAKVSIETKKTRRCFPKKTYMFLGKGVHVSEKKRKPRDSHPAASYTNP